MWRIVDHTGGPASSRPGQGMGRRDRVECPRTLAPLRGGHGHRARIALARVRIRQGFRRTPGRMGHRPVARDGQLRQMVCGAHPTAAAWSCGPYAFLRRCVFRVLPSSLFVSFFGTLRLRVSARGLFAFVRLLLPCDFPPPSLAFSSIHFSCSSFRRSSGQSSGKFRWANSPVCSTAAWS
jgi:hypothetical protein